MGAQKAVIILETLRIVSMRKFGIHSTALLVRYPFREGLVSQWHILALNLRERQAVTFFAS
jgi:hypothetical protein